MITEINSEDRAVQQTFAHYLENNLGWDSFYAWNQEDFGAESLLGRTSMRDVVLTRDLKAAIVKLNDDLPESAVDDAVHKLTGYNFSRSTLQRNSEFYEWIREGVPVQFKDKNRKTVNRKAKVIDFRDALHDRFLVVRELKIQGLVTCARMYQRIIPRWKAKAIQVRAEAGEFASAAGKTTDTNAKEALQDKSDQLSARADWMDETLIQIIISEENVFGVLRESVST